MSVSRVHGPRPEAPFAKAKGLEGCSRRRLRRRPRCLDRPSRPLRGRASPGFLRQALSQTRLFCSRRSADHAAPNAPRRSFGTKRRGRRPISLRSVSDSPRERSRRMLQTAFATPPALPGSSFEAPSGARLTWVFEAGSEPNAPVLLAAIRRSCRAECAPAFTLGRSVAVGAQSAYGASRTLHANRLVASAVSCPRDAPRLAS